MTEGNGNSGGERPGNGDLATGISIGTAIGVALGLTVFDNIALGIGVGMAFGVALGSARRNRREPPGGSGDER
ncbi:hypothetical protein [Streptomyces radiopugnans]|uniref:Glycine zipper-like domain-containing protein n=1 Tax=Streptomyces radiopugnans TaxID=403935 RepID=A0A1H9EBQ5_9ACTN|nr:hypothetical protein [Streptomyces radiopugnans]SEQ23059.1 hypothetical protein SAMN05216481_10533 [Streptomyces radiopugnans]